MRLEKQSSPGMQLIISHNAQEEIRLLCGVFPNREWSGYLVYRMAYSKEEEDYHIYIDRIIPLDVGTETETEYDDGYIPQAVKDLLEDDGELRLGHIHSHNTQEVFFSSTDINELVRGAEKGEPYLSLIVNNLMEMEAKLCVLAKPLTGQDIILGYMTPLPQKNVVTRHISELEPLLLLWECPITLEGGSEDILFNRLLLELLGKLQQKLSNQTYSSSLPIDYTVG